MNIEEIRAQVKNLQEQVSTLEKQEREEREALRKKTKRRWRFALRKYDRDDAWRALRPGCGVVRYNLTGTVLNKDECQKVGYGEREINGGMNYLVNVLNGRIIGSDGGGTLFIADRLSFSYSKESKEEREEDVEHVYASLEAAIAAGVEDVTDVILQQRHFAWK